MPALLQSPCDVVAEIALSDRQGASESVVARANAVALRQLIPELFATMK